MPARKQASLWAQIGFYTTLGFTIPASTVAGLFLGWWLDRELKTAPALILILGLAGAAGGVVEVLRVLKKAENDASGNDAGNGPAAR